MLGKIFDEVTGAEAADFYEATLNEDMIDTFMRLGRTYIDVSIPALYSKLSYPAVYVPSEFRTLPLRRGDKVYVKFNQDNPKYPYLWKVSHERFETSMFTPPPFKPGSEATWPTSDKLVAVQKFNENFYFYVTDSYVYQCIDGNMTCYDKKSTSFSTTDSIQFYTKSFIVEATEVFRQKIEKLDREIGEMAEVVSRTYSLESNGAMSFKTQDALTVEAQKSISVSSVTDALTVEAQKSISVSSVTDALTVEALSDVTVKSSTGNLAMEAMLNVDLKSSASGFVTIGNASGTLGALIGELIQILSTLTTQGSPATQVISPATIAQLVALNTKWQLVFK